MGVDHYGVYQYAQNTSTTQAIIENNTADNNSIGVLILGHAGTGQIDATVRSNSLTNNSSEGLRIIGRADTTVNVAADTNTVNGNTRGIRVDTIVKSDVQASFSNNLVTDNTGNGIYIDDGSTLATVVDFGGGALGSSGNNSIFNNAGTEVRVDLDGGELKAENNWWGVATGLASGETTLTDGTVDADPLLTAAP